MSATNEADLPKSPLPLLLLPELFLQIGVRDAWEGRAMTRRAGGKMLELNHGRHKRVFRSARTVGAGSLLILGWIGCSSSESDDGCASDAECKGDRVCVSGSCRAPRSAEISGDGDGDSGGDGSGGMSGDGDEDGSGGMSGDGDEDGSGGMSGDGDGDGDLGGATGDGDGDTPGLPEGITLDGHTGNCGRFPVTFRDFKGNGEVGSHPDFEISVLYPAGNAGGTWSGAFEYGDPMGSQPYKGVDEAGCDMVEATVGQDGKPTFNHGLGGQRTLSPEAWSPGVVRSVVSCGAPGIWNWSWTPPNSIMNATTFSSWYNDEPAYNITIQGELPLVEDPSTGISQFESPAFFPIDDLGHGNTPGYEHNFHFTTEAHVSFEYVPGSGQLLTFTGDDDVWVFVNGQRAIDLGGIHTPMTMTVNFDARAAELGLTAAGTYRMDLFHAERETSNSNFRLSATNISCFTPVVL